MSSSWFSFIAADELFHDNNSGFNNSSRAMMNSNDCEEDTDEEEQQQHLENDLLSVASFSEEEEEDSGKSGMIFSLQEQDQQRERTKLEEGIEDITTKMIALIADGRDRNNYHNRQQEQQHDNKNNNKHPWHSHSTYPFPSNSGNNNQYNYDNGENNDDCSVNSEGTPDVVVAPSVEVSTKHAEKVTKEWAKELYEIRREDREAIQDEMHGVKSRAIHETDELCESSLQAMEGDLESRMASYLEHRASALEKTLIAGHYRATKILRSVYVTGREFRMRFLRAEFFDVPKAVVRYCKYLNHMHQHFGDISLERTIYMSDLTEREQNYLKNGYHHPLMPRDKMGRRVYIAFGGMHYRTVSMRERHRVELYLSFAVISEDESTQLHGMVNATFTSVDSNNGNTYDSNGSPRPFQNWDAREKKNYRIISRDLINNSPGVYTAMIEACPYRLSAFHLCMPDERIFHFFKAIMLGVIPSNYRALTRVHTGSQMECNYALGQFGIPIASSFKSKSFEQFLKARAAMDKFRQEWAQTNGVKHCPLSVCPGTDCPESNCVVFGHRTTYNYPANMFFRDYLRSMQLTVMDTKKTTTAGAASTSKNNNNTTSSNSKNKTMRLNVDVLDKVIDDLSMMNPSSTGININTNSSSGQQQERFRFAIYEKDVGWYRYMDPLNDTNDRKELRKRISQTIRDDRKRTVRQTQTRQGNINNNNDAADNMNFGTTISDMGVDAKRFKRKRYGEENSGCFY